MKIISAMEQYAKQEGECVENFWNNAVASQRDELDENYKIAVRDRNTAREMYKETVMERDGWISEYRAAHEEVERLKLYLDRLKKELSNNQNDGTNSSHIHSGGKGGWSV